MAGGGTSNLDLVLYLIGRFVGLREALDVAQGLPDRLARGRPAAVRLAARQHDR